MLHITTIILYGKNNCIHCCPAEKLFGRGRQLSFFTAKTTFLNILLTKKNLWSNPSHLNFNTINAKTTNFWTEQPLLPLPGAYLIHHFPNIQVIKSNKRFPRRKRAKTKARSFQGAIGGWRVGAPAKSNSEKWIFVFDLQSRFNVLI